MISLHTYQLSDFFFEPNKRKKKLLNETVYNSIVLIKTFFYLIAFLISFALKKSRRWIGVQ